MYLWPQRHCWSLTSFTQRKKSISTPLQALKRQQAKKRVLKHYRENKAKEMQNVTRELLNDFLVSDKLNQVLHQKLQLLQKKFEHLLNKIPNLIRV